MLEISIIIYLVVGLVITILQIRKDKMFTGGNPDFTNGMKVVSMVFFPLFIAVLGTILCVYILKIIFKAILSPIVHFRKIKVWWSQTS